MVINCTGHVVASSDRAQGEMEIKGMFVVHDKGKRGGGKRLTEGQVVLVKRGINCKR